MKKRFLLLVLMTVCGIATIVAAGTETATAPYKIEVEAPQLKNDTLKLAMYFYGKLYARDTVVLDSRGYGAFSKEKPLQEGMYAIYFNNSKYFDLLIGDIQNFKVQIADTTDLLTKVNIIGANQSEAFLGYVKFISEKRAEMEALNKEYANATKDPEKEAERKTKVETIDKQVEAFQTAIINAYRSKTVSVILKALSQPKPADIVAENDSIKRVKQYYYNRAHYFDNINLSDPRLLYTGFLPSKINFYVEKMIPQIPDTVVKEVVMLVEKSRGDTLTFQNMLGNMLNYAVSNKQMGMDKLTLVLSRNYYLTGLAYWADEKLLKDLEEEVRKIEHNQIGAEAHNLKTKTFDGVPLSLFSLPQDFVLVYFYEPSCGHCKKETPILYDSIYQKYKDDNFFEVFAFYLHTEKAEWKKFIDDNKLYDWTNVWDPTRESYFWIYYDTTVTPGLYLLNKEHKIIAKKISLETLEMILENERAKKEGKTVSVGSDK